MPVRVEHRVDAARQLQHILRMRGVTAVNQEASVRAGKHDDVISRSRNEHDLVVELRPFYGSSGGLTKRSARQTERGCPGDPGGQDLEEFTAFEFHHG